MFLHAKTSTFHRSFQTDYIVKNKKNAVTISDNIVVNFLFLFIHLFFLNFSRFLLSYLPGKTLVFIKERRFYRIYVICRLKK